MLDLGDDEALKHARAELRAVQAAAFQLAVLMAHFAEEAARLADLIDELEATET